MGYREVVVHDLSRRKLASVDLAVARLGLPALSPQSLWPSLHKSSAACGQCCAPFSVAAAGDRIYLAQSVRGRAVCPAPGQRRVCSLGRRAQECAQHAVLLACAACLRPVCAEGRPLPLSVGSRFFSLALMSKPQNAALPLCLLLLS